MGVKKLIKSLEEIYNELNLKKDEPIKYTKPINFLEKKRVAIDASLWMYQGKCAILGHTGSILNSKGTDVSLIIAILNRVIYLLKCNIKPVFVFDGKPPALKNETVNIRKENKKKAKKKLDNNEYENETEKNKLTQKTCNLTRTDIQLFQKLLDYLGIPYINSPSEADSQCAYLYQIGLVDYIISEDSDIIVFGGDKIIKEFKASTTTVEIFDITNLYKNTKITPTTLIDIALILGCDYFSGLKGVGIKRIIKQLMNNEELLLSKDNQMKEIVNYYKNPIIKTELDKIELKKINFEGLQDFLNNEIELPTTRVLAILATLRYTLFL